MTTQKQLDKVYMQNAVNIATLSHARRKKVGCVLVTPDNVMLSSYNGIRAFECVYYELVLNFVSRQHHLLLKLEYRQTLYLHILESLPCLKVLHKTTTVLLSY